MLRINLSAVGLACVGLVLTWYILPPSHDRVWRDDYAVLPNVAPSADGIELTGVRDWSYDDDGMPTDMSWRTVTLDPGGVARVWFVVEPFGAWDAVAHTMLAFEFADGRAYVASVEARREVGETYRAAQGAVWPSYEYLVVWTTERDMYANTVLAAGDRLHLYPLSLPDGMAEGVLRAMLSLTAGVADRPRWYNTVTANCTSELARAMNAERPGTVPLDLAWVLPGYAAGFLYDEGWMPGARDFAEIEAASDATDAVREVYRDTPAERFSQALRRAWGGAGA